MNKSCDNCYWRHEQPHNKFCGFNANKPIENVCSEHNTGCEHCFVVGVSQILYREIARFQFKGEQYCEGCMADELGIEIREYSCYQYYDASGNFLGDSKDMELEDIFLKDSRIECFEE